MEDFFDEIRLGSSNFETRVLGFPAELTPSTPSTVHYNSDKPHQYRHENDSTRDFEDDRSDATERQAHLEYATHSESLVSKNISLNNEDDLNEEITTLRSPKPSSKSHKKDLTSDEEDTGEENDDQSSSVGKEEDTRSEEDDQPSDSKEASHDLGKNRFSQSVELQGLDYKFILQESRSITISDDFSHGAKVEERRFLALRTSIERPPKRVVFKIRPTDGDAILIAHLCGGPKKYTMAMQRRMERGMTTLSNSEFKPELSTQIAHTKDESHLGKRTHSEYVSNIEVDDKILGLNLVELQGYITRLEKRAKNLGALEPNPQQTYWYSTLYRILEYKSSDPLGRGSVRALSRPFFDPPEWVGSRHNGTLRCSVPVENFDLFLEKNKDISFIVYKTYVLLEPGRQSDFLQPEDAPKFKIDESIKPVTEDLIGGVRSLLESKDEFSELWQIFKATKELNAPYLFVYHQRADWDRLRGDVAQSSQEQLMMLWNYIIQSHGDEYAAADRLIASGKITSKYIQYLFKPGDILIQYDGDFHLGWVAKSWAKYEDTFSTARGKSMGMNTRGSRIPLYGTIEASKRMANGGLWFQNWHLSGWNWEFDGNFQRREKVLSFSIPEETNSKSESANILKAKFQDTSVEDGIPIQDLRVYPIRHAPEEIVQKLRKRCKTFWKCRVRGFVSYEEDRTKDTQENTIDERYMIDLQAYRSLHKNNQYDRIPQGSGLADELGPEAMKKDEPPDDKFELLLPPTIKGFNMRRKKWYDLIADRINDVKWNKEAFQKIVMNRKVKDLIQALVSNQLAAETDTFSTDIIEGKGNGLILLLHGSPGTGKTLTAESVAEIAEKPLYRVTCADIGTKAEDAEKYLESVLHLGKLWKCVVLLDEADIFLERRSLEDLERNALVSVFLRVLEYYEGILILTSNRVGIFDEAFKSRIQLALYYPTLGPYERLQIWQNFFEKLDSLHDATIDVDDLRDHLVELKEEEMNGRQIRNAITTARQYAKWKGETLTHAKLKDVIEVAGRFDKYLDRLNRGLTQDQLAEDEGLRLR
ncbi:hypothetical protein E0Z10_g5894 [Xylaria hypoxylon]|uniref:EF-hand domain-containing protein n=1 Tax=Xylaria hypoxylon TaxID=37992 RepID=A0A4Z0YHG0_9PEZI|nr:hypothetical protein E0Z10_g5894 [Xylaria hypoxylon]